MLKITLFELITRGIPEGFLFVLAVLAFAKKKIDTLPYILCSVILIIFTYSVRLLQINFGVHTILNLICLIVVSFFINKIDLFTTVKGAMFATLAMFVIEAINVVVLQFAFKDGFNAIIDNPFQKALAGIPGIAIFGIIVVFLYFYRVVRHPLKGNNGTVSE